MLKMQLNISSDSEADSIEISSKDWYQSLLDKIRNKSNYKVKVAKTFKATLREYQEVGFEWLSTMMQLRFGALLADDMGLGKTIQILALLESNRNKKIKSLLVLPASLIGNWVRESASFAPKLRIKVLHKSFDGITVNLEEADLFITTYAMVQKIDEIFENKWDLLILDESQAIKNSGTKQTRAIKKIDTKMKIALTGTPIENRLDDLWSLFDFLNPGILGNKTEFSRFVKDLKNSESGYLKLKTIINPFILRRLKTDKSIISDLPDKFEIKQYTNISSKQATLYKKVVTDLSNALADDLEYIQKRGLVLASLTKLKQICNHPDQYIGTKEFKHNQSGKIEMLRTLGEVIHDKHESVLVFTQFKEMTQPLSDFLKDIFGKEGFIIDGSTPVKKRNEYVNEFNNENNYVPYMVLSLKAGGVGLNLTSANHVIHFDRWWNPAVENQATDRAFRIGQTKDVEVHKFIMSGTIEEKIDELIESKLKLSQDVIPLKDNENWITKMSDSELLELFRLE
jgi:non-specific serine/threonine protein kinase